MWDLVGNPKDLFSHDAAHVSSSYQSQAELPHLIVPLHGDLMISGHNFANTWLCIKYTQNVFDVNFSYTRIKLYLYKTRILDFWKSGKIRYHTKRCVSEENHYFEAKRRGCQLSFG